MTFPNSEMSENPEFLLRAGIKKRLMDLKSDHGKTELWGVWLPGGVQNPKATSVFCWGTHVARSISIARQSVLLPSVHKSTSLLCLVESSCQPWAVTTSLLLLGFSPGAYTVAVVLSEYTES